MDYRHLRALTDGTGMLQFSRLDTPDPASGYTVDDNARALMVALGMQGEERAHYARIFCGFLWQAQRPDGSWCNWKVGDEWRTEIDSQDSLGRAFLACTTAVGCGIPEVEVRARRMAARSLPAVRRVTAPRAMAYVVLGCAAGLGKAGLPGDHLLALGRDFCRRLTDMYHASRGPGWRWFETALAYCNAVLPHALLAFSARARVARAPQAGLDALDFLADHLCNEGYLNVVGNRGWWRKPGPPARFDQQPVDAGSMALACLEAHQATGRESYLRLARLAHDWFQGRNVHGLPLINPSTGGCYDALVPEGVNRNQGAESLLAWLLTRHALRDSDWQGGGCHERCLAL